MTRRLAAILAADVVGYTAIMGADEDGTFQRLADLRQDFLQPLIEKHRGRIFKLMGDGLLVEFASVVDAIACAIAWQEQIGGYETGSDPSTRLRFRIGINLGDVIVEGSDIHGEGVNIAARLEALAMPGGVCLSADAYRHARRKVEAEFEDMGEQVLKNVAEPVRTYRIVVGTSSAAALVGAGALPLPNRPSVAVLPFTNLSGDSEQDYFADGITEDIITELSRFNSLFVIARNSSFHFKGLSPNVQDVGNVLGVLYIVEGSVRRAGNRVRVTAQLVEAETGKNLWSERYDRNLEDIFAVQDDVVSNIAMMVPGRVEIADRIKSERKATCDIGAYDLVLRADWLTFNGADLEAVLLLEKAVKIDPDFAAAHAKLAQHAAWGIFVHGHEIDAARIVVKKHGETATQLAPGDAEVHSTLSEAYGMVGEHQLAAHHAGKAISLNRNAFHVMAYVAWVRACQGDHENACELLEKAMRNDPYSNAGIRENKLEIYYMAGRYAECAKQLIGWPNPPLHTKLAIAAALAQLNRVDEAKTIVQQVNESAPEGWEAVNICRAYQNMCAQAQDGDHWLEGFRKAGICI